MAKLYSREDVSRHNQEKDLWIVIHDRVYDVTRFLKEHPGGEEVLLNLAGGDATVCFDDIGHSQEAQLLRENYKIGEIIGSQRSEAFGEAPLISETKGEDKVAQGPATQDDDDWEYEETPEKKSILVPIFVGVAFLVYAIIFQYLL